MKSSEAIFPKKMNVEPASRKMKIAIIYGRTPLPMRRADQMTVAHLLAFLKARGHHVDLFYLDTGADANQQERDWLAAQTVECHSYKLDRVSALRGLMRTVFKFAPFQVGLFSHPEQAKAVRKAVAENHYDIVYTYYFRSAEITKDLGFKLGTPKEKRGGKPATFLAFQLSQTLNTTRIAKNAPDIWHKWFYELESRLVARYESRIWKRFTRSVLIGKSDVEEIRKACRAAGLPEIDNYVYGAHGTDVSRFRPRDDIAVKPDHLVFSGVMRTPTNVQAVQWFARNVWPLVRQAKPEATWWIVGREPNKEVQELGSLPGVTVTGTVDNPAELIAAATICINPMQAGGGMQNKLIEYLASGKAVVATPVANEGINAPDGTLLVAESPEEFAAAIIKLLNAPEEAAELGARARAYALEQWTWEWHYLKLEDDFLKAIE